MTGPEIAAAIEQALLPLYGATCFRVRCNESFGETSIHVTFASVPRAASELEAVNAKRQIMISINAAKDKGRFHRWLPKAPAPEKLKAHTFRHRDVTFRAKTGTPKQIVDTIIKFFVANQDDLLGAVR